MNRSLIPSFVTDFFQDRFFSFVDRRNVSQNHQRLTQKNLFIFPSMLGLYFLCMTGVLWMLGTNYQNNMVLGLVFLLVSVFLIAILQTFSNLVGLDITFKKATPVFAGDDVEFIFSVTNPNRRHREALECSWQDDDRDHVVFDVPPGETVIVRIPLKSARRGRLKPGRLLLQTYYPLGIFRCWTWIRWDIETVVYPKPIEIPQMKSTVTTDEEGDGLHPTQNGDDFSALHEYRDGDSLKHVAWKSYAREQGLYTKEFKQNLSQELWLDFDAAVGVDVEHKISGLAYWAIRFHQMDENYGLRLPGQDVLPDKGERHQMDVLTRLALYGLSERPPENRGRQR